MLEWRELASLVAAWLIVACGGLLMLVAMLRGQAFRKPILPKIRLRSIDWTGGWVLGAFVLFFVLPPMVFVPLEKWPWIHQLAGDPNPSLETRRAAAALGEILFLPLQIVAVLAMIALRTGNLRVLRLQPPLHAVFKAAYATWLVFTPAVFLLNAFTLLAYHGLRLERPEEHPILEVLQGASQNHLLVALLAIHAIVIASIKEELFFRGFLQSWLLRHPYAWLVGLTLAMIVGILLRWPAEGNPQGWSGWLSTLAPAIFALVVMTIAVQAPIQNCFDQLLPIANVQLRSQARNAILASALIFANFHSAVWPTPIPLFLFALALGWLRFRSGSLLACVLLHALFNLVGLLAAWFRL